ncbi:MAG: hypothetical protein HY706_16350 [Candidatus Hydrogenedentes bacterium]|nr:hypothetical protein [Candidatus Hydrogenedentota bacterium]
MRHAMVLSFFVLFISAEALPQDVSHRISAAQGPYFLCDSRVVEDRWLVERFVVSPQRHPKNPLIVRDRPWEGTGPHLGGSVLYDPEDTRYKMWYSVWNKHAYYNKLPFSYNVCYAESKDGIAWRKPNLGVFDYEGRTDNNCIKLGTDKTQNIDVCLNPAPDKWPGKFLAIHNQKGGVFVSCSQDGKTFTRLWETPAISYHSDTHNNFIYDDVLDRWLLYCRPRAWAGYHRRRVAFQESPDLQHWTHERTILVPSETDAPEFYGMTVFRRGDLFFGTLQTYDNSTGHMEAELAWSGDGVHWDQIATHPRFVRRGTDGSWDAGMVIIGENPVEVGDELRFYYGGFALPHNAEQENVAGIGLLTTERDRLIGLRPSSGEPGFILTRPFLVNGKRLLVNARIEGELCAELRTDNNKVIPGWSLDDCDPVTASGYSQGVTWKGKALKEVGEPEVRILFRLAKAELFTFDLADQ